MSEIVGNLDEDALIEAFFAPLAPDLSDDVATIEPSHGRRLLITTDALLEKVHFLRNSRADWVGQKAVRANVSDIVADGGRPRWLTLTLGLPNDLPVSWVAGFARGLAQACSSLNVRLIGGDTTCTRSDIFISVTAIGEVDQVGRVTRSGALPGHLLAVTGYLGESGIGLDMVLGKNDDPRVDRESWMARHFIPPFRGSFSWRAADFHFLSAMMDLSDGLVQDLPRLCRASGVGAEVDLEVIPVSRGARELGLTAREAVTRGEDFELLMAFDPEHQESLRQLAHFHEVPFTRIGRIVAGKGVRFLEDGVEVEGIGKGWRHFGTPG